MKFKTVPREQINISKKSSSKYKPLLDAVKMLEPGKEALEVGYKSEAELASIRNVVYTFNRENDRNIKSSNDSKKNIVYFYEAEEEKPGFPGQKS